MPARLMCALLLVLSFATPAGAATVPYLGGQVEMTGVVQPGATLDRIRIANQQGEIFDVVVSRDSTFVSSRALLRAQQVVRVDGRLVSGRDGAGQTIAAEEISDGSFGLSTASAKARPNGWTIAIGAAAGVLLGSGVYMFRKSLFGSAPTSATPGTTSLSSGVQFGGNP